MGYLVQKGYFDTNLLLKNKDLWTVAVGLMHLDETGVSAGAVKE